MKCTGTKCEVVSLMAASRVFCCRLTAGTYRLETTAEKYGVGVVPVPVLGHSLSALGAALSGLRRGGEAPWSDDRWNRRWWLRAAIAPRLCVLDMLESSGAEGEPDGATERVSIEGNISHLAHLWCPATGQGATGHKLK